MKTNFLLFVVALLILGCLSASNLRAQPVDTTLLCPGAYFTEAQGKAALEQFAATYHDKTSWEKRAEHIRQTIIQGARLEQLPEHTPLKPIIHSKRTYDGY